jgi:hypothetical protein
VLLHVFGIIEIVVLGVKFWGCSIVVTVLGVLRLIVV